MRKSPDWVRESIRQGTLPIGTCTRMPGKTRDNFYISPKKFFDYVGDTFSFKASSKEPDPNNKK